jgi:hypothetical protein
MPRHSPGRRPEAVPRVKVGVEPVPAALLATISGLQVSGPAAPMVAAFFSIIAGIAAIATDRGGGSFVQRIRSNRRAP